MQSNKNESNSHNLRHTKLTHNRMSYGKLLKYMLCFGSEFFNNTLITAQESADKAEASSFDDSCFELGPLIGRNPSSDTELQTDYNKLLAESSVLQSDSKIRTIKVCYEDRSTDQSLFSMQLEVWSRATDQNMWLSFIGHSNITDDEDCDVYTPSRDFVLSDLILDAHPTLGISYVRVIFSSDYYDVGEVPEKKEIFEFGQSVTALGNEKIPIGKPSQKKAFMGWQTVDFKETDVRIPRLGPVYFTCGSWTPPVEENETSNKDDKEANDDENESKEESGETDQTGGKDEGEGEVIDPTGGETEKEGGDTGEDLDENGDNDEEEEIDDPDSNEEEEDTDTNATGEEEEMQSEETNVELIVNNKVTPEEKEVDDEILFGLPLTQTILVCAAPLILLIGILLTCCLVCRHKKICCFKDRPQRGQPKPVKPTKK